MKKILLPTDFSDNAQKAIDYALYLFEKETCTFYLLHAYFNVPSATGNKMTAKEDLKQLAQTLEAKNNSKHLFKTIMETDSVINLVNRTVINKGVDFVFMGTKGSSAMREILIGGNTTDVLKHLVFCPVVTVPEGHDHGLPEEIVFATDFKHRFEKHELVPLIILTKIWNSRLTVVHVHTEKELNDDQKQNKELLKQGLKPIKSKFMEIKMEDTIAGTLRNFEREKTEIGLLALLRTRHGYFQKLLREPVVRNMAFRTEVPFMVLPIVE
ncbi:Nucleotide-binding universal stress protein, UspA family [Pricia antarctica]|uniref:Nucleotide-binding universal stress protein, UspA family n=1 Tax=Pricia antarctica TaxID=641691 RepID=A0A1G7DAP4_9FLAO|nr:universal stress protein [Pricia antarctica]SDE48622.1 Nucleotide-binding universal stress protein, UspA family [Pricia antarctica]